jgi:hypothetical protein
MKENQLISMLGAVLAAIFLTAPLLAADFEITKVIEVGPADEGFMSWPLRWSPDGKWLAFFRDGWLMLSDTLGVSKLVTNYAGVVLRYEWSTDSTIIGFFRMKLDGDSTSHQLVNVKITDGSALIVDEYITHSRHNEDESKRRFNGPWRTLGAKLYYDLYEGSGLKPGSLVSQRRLIMPNGELRLFESSVARDSVLRWGTDGLYSISITGNDSLKLSTLPYKATAGNVVLNSDQSHYLVGGTIVRLSDSRAIVLDTVIRTIPEKAISCGFVATTFGPTEPVVLFQFTCDYKEGDDVYSDQIGVFNYETHELTILPCPDDLHHCKTPQFSPDGRRIAFIGGDKAFILTVKWNGGNQ